VESGLRGRRSGKKDEFVGAVEAILLCLAFSFYM
jgi:hypothetical protein